MNLKFEQFKKMCNDNNIGYRSAYYYRKNHPELTDEQIIEYYNNKNNGVLALKEKCRLAKVNYDRALKFKYKHPELTAEQIIEYYLTKEPSFKSKCKETGIDYISAKAYKRLHPELTTKQIIDYYLNKEFSFRRKYKEEHPELTDEQIIYKYKHEYKHRKTSIRQRCLDSGISYSGVISFKHKHNHNELTYDKIIELYKAKKLFLVDNKKSIKVKEEIYYHCKCKTCNLDTILTVGEMLEHSNICRKE